MSKLTLESGSGSVLLESGGYLLLEEAPVTSARLLLESGDFLLLESGGYLLLEEAAPVTTVRPSADVVDGSWLNQAASAVNLYASVDDTPTDDATWIQSALTAGPDAVTLALDTPGGTPPAGEWTITLRIKRV